LALVQAGEEQENLLEMGHFKVILPSLVYNSVMTALALALPQAPKTHAL
jgi:hypothetical protein